MRQGSSNNRRPRNRHHNNGGGGSNNGANGNGANGGGNPSLPNPHRVRSAASLRHQTFDSNGPDVRVRGNAWQVYEKYQSLARDAFSSGDRVLAENYQQHAEHYYRVIEAINDATALEQRGRVQHQAFAPQPDMPQNYFTADGTLMGASAPVPVGTQGDDSAPADAPQPMAQAEVVRRTPPASALYSPEEIAEHHGAAVHQPLRMSS